MDDQDSPGRLQFSVMIEKRLEVIRKKNEASLLQKDFFLFGERAASAGAAT